MGVALSDPELTLAHPAGNIETWGDYDMVVDEAIGLAEDNDVCHIVVGLPLLMSGQAGAAARKARRWAQRLRYRLVTEGHGDITVALVDERLTTVTAHRQMSQAGLSTRRHRAGVDQQAAVIILQTALDAHEAGNGDAVETPV